MVKTFKRTSRAAETKVPVLWHDHAWDVRILILPEALASAPSLWPGRLSHAVGPIPRWSSNRAWRHRPLAKSRFGGECARFAGAAVSLRPRRTQEQAPRTLPRNGFSRFFTEPRNLRLRDEPLAQSEPLLCLAALPLGGSASPHLNIRHFFKNSPSNLI